MTNTVYVLGVDYQVIETIHWSHAVTHILEGTMSPFKVHPTKRVRSAGGSVDMAHPLIVRLEYWAPAARYRKIDLDSRASRKEILKRDGWTCAYCGAHANTVDHVKPESFCRRDGDPHNGWTWGNLVAACLSCNQHKADRYPEDAGMKLLWSPHTNTSQFGDVQEEVWKILEDGGGYYSVPALLKDNRKKKVK